MNNQTPFDSSNVPSASSSSAKSVPTPENFAQAMNHISQLLRMMGNPFAVRHFGNETYYNSVLNGISGMERDFFIFLTVMATQAREYQERLNEAKTHAQTELLLIRGKRNYAQLDSRARRADDQLAEEEEKLAEETRPKKRQKRSAKPVAKDSLPSNFPPPPPPPNAGATPMEV